ncbi:MAG: hypothetical protein U0W24_11055 [Bacteroidales bacterium]
MRTLKINLLVILAFLFSAAIHAQTIDEILAKHAEAVGGINTIKKLTSIYIENSIAAMGNESPNTVSIINGKGYKSVSEINGAKMINCFTEKSGWSVNPMMGATTPAAMPEEEYNRSKYQIFISDPLINSSEKGFTVELAGSEKVKDADAFKIKITNIANKSESFYYVDKTSYLILKVTAKVDMMGQQTDVITNFSNYQKTSIGFLIPYVTDIDFGASSPYRLR